MREENVKYVRRQETDKSANVKPVFYQPEISLPVKMVFSDLTKTVVVTILALVLQIGISIFLTKGGWQWINSIWFANLIK